MNPLIQLPRVHLDRGARAVPPDVRVPLEIARPLFVTDRGVGCGAFARAVDRPSAAELRAMMQEAWG